MSDIKSKTKQNLKIIRKLPETNNNSTSLSYASSDASSDTSSDASSDLDIQTRSVYSQETSPTKISFNDREQGQPDEQSSFSSNYPYLYPEINDPEFNKKIAEKMEFNDTQYDGRIHNVTEEAERLSRAEFELLPHQQFVKNFLSFQTPYNSLLLYHGLGSGKTCSAIGIAEEMRQYITQIGSSQKIIVVASPNVQENFKLQLFNESALELVDGLWNIKSCTGNKLLREINPMNMKGLSKEKIISQINKLIN